MAAPSQRPARGGPGPLTRVHRAWGALGREQHLCAFAALALWFTMFFPWYSENGLALGRSGVRTGGISLTAWSAFSWVEAMVLAVSVGVLGLLFVRGEARAFRLLAGDGTMIALAGGWAALLIVYRMFDNSATRTVPGAGEISTGIEWGIFLALFAALWLAWTGLALRRAQRAEQPAAPEPPPGRPRRGARVAAVPAAAEERALPRPPHRGVTREDARQLSFELPEDRRE